MPAATHWEDLNSKEVAIPVVDFSTFLNGSDIDRQKCANKLFSKLSPPSGSFTCPMPSPLKQSTRLSYSVKNSLPNHSNIKRELNGNLSLANEVL
jgi:hypothetical protein